VVARCFAFVGADLPLNVHFAIGNFIRDALTADALTVSGDGTPLRTYLDQSDLAHWLFTMLERGRSGEDYNVSSDGNCQERCHLLEAFYASLAKATWRLVCWVANGSLIHTKSGCFQHRIDLLQRFGFAKRACS